MEKRRCVKTDEITVNMLVHALRDVFREEKEAGASTKETGDLILRLAGHKDKKLYLTEGEPVSYTHLTLPTILLV